MMRGVVGVLIIVFVLLEGCAPVRQRTGFADSGKKTASAASKTSDTKVPPPTADSDRKAEAWRDEMEGLASWYGQDFNGHLTASGEVYDMYEMTAAHKTLPLQTVVKVHSLENGKTITVRINDRGPYVKGRVIDLSRKAARALGMREDGTARVRLGVKRWP